VDTALLDALGRTPIADGLKQQIAAELASIPEGKRGAIVFLGTGDGARMYLAAKYDRWKVAGGLGWMVGERRPSGHVSVEFCF
jgi:N-acetylglucosamine kinase-like BadF-type ATPase